MLSSTAMAVCPLHRSTSSHPSRCLPLSLPRVSARKHVVPYLSCFATLPSPDCVLVVCPANTYAVDTKSVQPCTVCGKHATSGSGAALCQCTPGSGLSQGACSACPPGTYKEVGDTLRCHSSLLYRACFCCCDSSFLLMCGSRPLVNRTGVASIVNSSS